MKQSGNNSRRRFLRTGSMLGLAVAFNPWKIFAASRTESTQADMFQNGASERQSGDKTAIRPFRWDFPEAQLTDPRSRVNAVKRPKAELVSDASQGVRRNWKNINAVIRSWRNLLPQLLA